jgi:perosamine synthetase
VVELARRHHLIVVEDAAEGAGVRYRGRHVGTFGDIGVFSFNGNKLVTSGGGGMLTTDDARIADYARYLTNQAKDDPIEYVHNEIGFNYRLTNLQAAVGLAQLECIDRFIARKRILAQRYREAVAGIEGVTLMPQPEDVTSTWWLFTVLLPESTTLARRQEIVRRLNEQGIGVRPLWRPAHSLPPHRDCQFVGTGESVRLQTRAISFPSSVGLTDAAQSRCVAAFRAAIAQT